ncbi:potassium/sodium hyperpolarization-activated cyclic nucleotide-gated channel 4-like [Pseudomyrmex gracilis]|uniref:potassium/sodium hyperpolarization-activated cyclic nucleotide-gated channel 4-like n=1 Tax=Pseudomyrmex gracilis TaxID=219809 RepID=UPI0009952589|nr:potassium/sodium hyperpolarization-activated cyclic nucleotide-gated channel 4-like [Pseudomyrmex gracilis]
MNKHKCELYVRKVSEYPFVRVKPLTLKNLWISWCGISKYTPKCALYMDSTAKITAERNRHAALNHWWIIHPFSYVRFLWEIFMTAIYLIAFFTIPCMICFVVMDYKSIRLDKVNIPIYAICWIDVAFNFVTGYCDEKNMSVELKLGRIFTFYLRGYFVLDALSSLPYDHLTMPWRRLPGDGSHFAVTLINLLPLLKLTRYSTLKSNINHLFTYLGIQNYNLCKTLLLALYLIVWFSCLTYFTPIFVIYLFNIPPTDCEDCWMEDLEDDSFRLRFKNSVYIAVINIMASGYGRYPPKTTSIAILFSLLMISGKFIACYILIALFRFTAESKISEVQYEEIINQVQAYVKHKNLLPHIRERILAYYHYRFRGSYFRTKRILSDLTELLRQEVAFHSCRRLIENVAIFKHLPNDVLQLLMNKLKFELYLPNDVIIKSGTQGDCMFFLSFGIVSVLTPTGKEICHLEDGAYFGEIALLLTDHRRIASVIAVDVCEVYRLDRKNFRQCVDVNSELFAEIERIASERIERTLLIEEQYKRYLPEAKQQTTTENLNYNKFS